MNHVANTELKTTTEQSGTVGVRTGDVNLPMPQDVAPATEQLVPATHGQGIELTGPRWLPTGVIRQVL